MSKTEKISCTVDEFNERYRISVLVDAMQSAELTNNQEELKYGPITGVIQNRIYMVIDRETEEEVDRYETEDDGLFIEYLRETFDIEGYEELF